MRPPPPQRTRQPRTVVAQQKLVWQTERRHCGKPVRVMNPRHRSVFAAGKVDGDGLLDLGQVCHADAWPGPHAQERARKRKRHGHVGNREFLQGSPDRAPTRPTLPVVRHGGWRMPHAHGGRTPYRQLGEQPPVINVQQHHLFAHQHGQHRHRTDAADRQMRRATRRLQLEAPGGHTLQHARGIHPHRRRFAYGVARNDMPAALAGRDGT